MANPNGRLLVATIAKPTPGLWAVPIPDRGRLARDSEVQPYPVPKAQLPWAPRFGPDKAGDGSLFFLSSSGSGDGLWRYHRETLTKVWNASDGALFEPAVLSRDGEQIAIKLRRNGRPVWQIGSPGGAHPQLVGESLEIDGGAAFSPDGRMLLAGGKDTTGPGLFRIPLDGGHPSRMISGDALHPIWSGEADLVVYSESAERNRRTLHAIRPDGTPVEIPRIEVNGAQTGQFLPNGTGLVYRVATDFYLLDLWARDLAAQEPRKLTDLTIPAAVESFDITPDGKQIVFDRHPRNSDIHLIELPAKG
jgi:Tol biopolymer transport system component